MQTQSIQVPVDMPLAVTLQAQQWSGVMSALVKAPYEIAAPLIESINNQLNQAAIQATQGPQTQDAPMPSSSNGLDHDPPEVRLS